jgi:hypothetical protein
MLSFLGKSFLVRFLLFWELTKRIKSNIDDTFRASRTPVWRVARVTTNHE